MERDAKNKKSRSPQARGIVRREQLLKATIELLSEKELDEVSLADVANRAEIPVASAYNFYPNINSVFSHLMVKFSHEVADEIEASILSNETGNWLEIVGKVCDGILDFYGRNRAYERIRLSGKAPGEIRYNEDRVRGTEFAPRMRELINRFYVVPDLADRDRPFLIMLDLVDGIYVSEYIREGQLSKTIAQEAKRAANAYLTLYIPQYLPKRTLPEIGCE